MTRTVNYDALAASTPINRGAALARDGGGVQFELQLPNHIEHWTAPPLPERNPSRDLPRLEGTVFGDGMRVVRYHGRRWDGARWLVRCACGDFELRSTKAVRTAQADHRCAVCSQTRSQRVTLDRDRIDPTWRDARPPSLKLKLSEPQLRFILATATGQAMPEGFTAQDRHELANRVRERLSGLAAT